jgi:membrane-bound lytic murein transglycosylase D
MEEPIPMTAPPHSRSFRCLPVLAAVVLLSGCASAPIRVVEPLTSPSTAPAPAPAPEPSPAPATPAATPAVATGPADNAAPLAPPEPLPRQRLDPEQDAETGDLWERIRAGMTLPDLDTELVRRWEQYYATRPDYVQRMSERGGRYLFHIVEEIERRGLPLDLALLPFIESAFDPTAKSRVAASGMWQFMPATGKDFDLAQNLFRDDRRSVLGSTRAALDYLQRLRGRFDDWHLALAAYNWGQGNVNRAVERNRRAGRDAGYLDLRMPDETRNYVPKLQAIKNIVRNPAAFGLTLPALENHPYFLTVVIERDIDVALVARLAGVTVEQFQQLNPQHNKPVILAAGTPELLLPYDNANRFVAALETHRGPMASWTAWVAPRTLKPADAARLAGTSESTLREINRIPPRMLLRTGATLLVPRSVHMVADVSERVADSAALLLAPEQRTGRRVVLRAGRQGESVASVARRHGLTAAQVAQWNQTTARGRFTAGQRIELVLPPRSAAQARARAAQPARAKTSAKAAPRAAAKAPARKPAPAAAQRPPR